RADGPAHLAGRPAERQEGPAARAARARRDSATFARPAGDRAMTQDIQSAQDDLAYLRALVQPKDQGQAPFGESYLAGGLLYGLQLVGHWAQATGAVVFSDAGALALGLGPTVVFLAVLGWIMWRSRPSPQTGTANRAVGLMFGSVGLANLVLIAVIGPLAWREH